MMRSRIILVIIASVFYCCGISHLSAADVEKKDSLRGTPIVIDFRGDIPGLRFDADGNAFWVDSEFQEAQVKLTKEEHAAIFDSIRKIMNTWKPGRTTYKSGKSGEIVMFTMILGGNSSSVTYHSSAREFEDLPKAVQAFWKLVDKLNTTNELAK